VWYGARVRPPVTPPGRAVDGSSCQGRRCRRSYRISTYAA